MTAPDDSALLHYGRYYDPQKAREYYLKTRELKGHHPSAETTPSSANRSTSESSVVDKNHSRQVEIKAQKEALERRLDRLKDVLAGLVEAAKARSGVETKTSSSEKSKDSKTETNSKKEDKPKTASEKKKAAEQAKEYYEKNKLPNLSPTQEVAALQKQISSIKARIQAALAEAHGRSNSNTQSVTASNGR